jgi:hypothetical protein
MGGDNCGVLYDAASNSEIIASDVRMISLGLAARVLKLFQCLGLRFSRHFQGKCL